MIYLYKPTQEFMTGILVISAKDREAADEIAAEYKDGYYGLEYLGGLEVIVNQAIDKGIFDILGSVGY